MRTVLLMSKCVVADRDKATNTLEIRVHANAITKLHCIASHRITLPHIGSHCLTFLEWLRDSFVITLHSFIGSEAMRAVILITVQFKCAMGALIHIRNVCLTGHAINYHARGATSDTQESDCE